MNSDESIHTFFSNIIDKWSENFKKDMEALLKVVDNIHMKNTIINEILKSMPEYKLLEESNKKLIIENLELKNRLQNNIILPEHSKELELCITDYEILETNKNNNIDSVENPDNIIINNTREENKQVSEESEQEESEEEGQEKEDKNIEVNNTTKFKKEEEEEEGDEEAEEEEEQEEGEEQAEEEGEEEAEEEEGEEEEGEEEAEQEEQEEQEEEQQEGEEEESEEEGEEEAEQEGEEEESEEEEVFLVQIQGKNYYTDSEKNGTIYQCLDHEDIGDKVGFFDKNGVAIFD